MALGLTCPAACGILVPLPEIKPVSPALEGGFFTTGPPGKSQNLLDILDSNKVLSRGKSKTVFKYEKYNRMF